MKKYLFAAWALCLTAGAVAQTYLSCDFESGMPSGFLLYDEDGLEPSVDMQRLGFAVGTPWVVMEESKTEPNHVAASTSYYKKAGTSSDWLVTPPFTVADAASVLQWRTRAYDAQYADGYSVYLSATATTPAEFMAEAQPVLTVAAEQSTWQQHALSLGQYVGQAVRAAFVNNSTDKSRLYLDDLFAGLQSKVYVQSTVPTMLDRAGEVAVTGRVYTRGSEPVSGLRIGLVADGVDYVEDFPETVVTASEDFTFTLQHKLTVAGNQTLDYTLWVEADGERHEQAGHTSAYAHKVVAEEGTGTWCSWCVRGIVMMAQAASQHPDHFIGIAVHNKDVMRYDDYDAYLGRAFGLSSYPNLVVNRYDALMGDPLNLELYYSMAMTAPYYAGIALEAQYNEATRSVTARSSLRFANDWTDAAFRLSYILVENDVHGDTDDYAQNNAYAGGGSGAMGGFERLPSPVPASEMYYQDVARLVVGDFEGIEGSVPPTIRAGEAVGHEATFNLPDNVLRPENCELVCLLLNADGSVANAEKAKLGSGLSAIADHHLADCAPETYDLLGRRTNDAKDGRHRKIVRRADGTGRYIVIIP